MKLRDSIFILIACMLASCNDSMNDADGEKECLIEIDGSDLHSEIVPFNEIGENALSTRVKIEGDDFESKDLIRLRVIAPYVSTTEYGESTWGNSYDNWRLYTWGGKDKKWGSVSATEFGFDMDGDFSPSNAPSTIVMPQATPFVFTATTFTEEIHYIHSTPDKAGGSVVLSFSNVFKSDQRRIENYKSCDVLWAQQFLQTGSDNVFLSFQHKMAALKIDISEFSEKLTGTEEVILTLENMPDINQQEVTIGNYYADKMKSKIAYGDYYRTKCDYDKNGKVLGIVVPKESEGHLVQIPFTELSQTGVYTAYKLDAQTFLLIIPPYTVPADVTPTLWLRQGEKRWSAHLTLPTEPAREFESGNRYNVTMKVPADPISDDDSTDEP